MSELVVAAGRHGPFLGRLEPDAIAAYAAATGDQTVAVRTGLAVPANAEHDAVVGPLHESRSEERGAAAAFAYIGIPTPECTVPGGAHPKESGPQDGRYTAAHVIWPRETPIPSHDSAPGRRTSSRAP